MLHFHTLAMSTYRVINISYVNICDGALYIKNISELLGESGCVVDRSNSSNYSGSLAELTNASHHTVSSSDYQFAPLPQTRSLRDDLNLLKSHNVQFRHLLDANPHLAQALNVGKFIN